jgi:geranylgeranyl pyrophosphate synthase
MDIYDQIFADLLGILPVQEWPDTRRLLQRAFGGRPPQWQLPVLTCQAIGASSEQARPAMAALACMQISIIVIDDLLDDDTRGEHHQIGAPAAANIACAFQAAGLEAIARSEIDAKNKSAIMTILNQMILKTAFGQYMDVQVPDDEAAYWQIVQTKSSPYFGSAIQIGALYAGAAMDVANQLRRFGDLYGEMIQIHDDMHDSMERPTNPD